MIQPKKIHFPALIILLTFIVQFFVAPDLWITSTREYPLVPAFSFLSISFPELIQKLLIGLMILSPLLLIFKPDQKKWLLLFILPALLFILEDITRLQPWFFLHLSMILIIYFEKELTPERVFSFLKWIVIAIYFWGGFNKLNTAFAWEIFPWFTQHLGIGDDYFLGMDNLHSFPLPDKNKIAYIIPVFEMLIAFFLFIPKLKWLGIASVLTTHLISLYAIGPWGHNWNQIVWPWNVEMILLTAVLFMPKSDFSFKNYIKNQLQLIKSKTGILILGLFFVAPFIGFFGFWDKALSLHLYSGNSDELEFYFDGYEENFAGTSLEQHLYLDTVEMKSMMRVEYWAIEQTGVPMYNSESYFNEIGKYLCGCLTYPENGGIKILRRSGFDSEQDTLQIPCKEL